MAAPTRQPLDRHQSDDVPQLRQSFQHGRAADRHRIRNRRTDLSMGRGGRAEFYTACTTPGVRPERGRPGRWSSTRRVVNDVTSGTSRSSGRSGWRAGRGGLRRIVITRDATKIPHARPLRDPLQRGGGILKNRYCCLPRTSSGQRVDSDLLLGCRVSRGQRCTHVGEIDVCPVPIGSESIDLMTDDRYRRGRDPSTGCGRALSPVRVSLPTGFTGEKGYEIYLRDATLHAETLWNAVLEAGKEHGLAVIAPAHHRRVAAGILSWGQDMDSETLPFQVNLGYQVPRTKAGDYAGRQPLEAARAGLEAGSPPWSHRPPAPR